jgi:hypothetical protein
MPRSLLRGALLIAARFCQTGGGRQQAILAVFWRFWLNLNGVDRWQGPNGQAMREQWRGFAVDWAREGQCQAEVRLQTALPNGGSQSVSTFS